MAGIDFAYGARCREGHKAEKFNARSIRLHPGSRIDRNSLGICALSAFSRAPTVITPLRTNRDLYLAIEQLTSLHRDSQISLETYLLAVLNRAVHFRDLNWITLPQFYELVASGFTGIPLPFSDTWREQYEDLPHDAEGFSGWHATIIRQIVDLREMAECGSLNNDQRYFGISAPRKSYWYNFDPVGYLECAIAGSFGGWQPGDDTGRQYVPGPVAVMADDGSIQSANPEDIPNPTYELPHLSWGMVKDFHICGQIYE